MRKLALFAAGFAAAASLYVYFVCDIRILWLAGICLLLSPLCLRLGLRRCCAVTLGILAGAVWCFGYGLIWMEPARQACGTEQSLAMEVLETPTATNYGSSVAVEVVLKERHYQAVLYGKEDLLETTPGDRIRCKVEIEPALSRDGYFYHQANGTVLLLQTNTEVEIEPGEPDWFVKLRMWFQQKIHSLYEGDTGALMLALLTGDQSELSYSLRNELSIVGLSHAVAVSGMHVAVLIAVLSMACGYNPRLTALLGIPLSISFVLMTGASASACRSAVMQIIMLTAPMMRRESDSWTNLAAAALLLLLENPWAITGVGFQLSFAAVSGLLLFSSPIQRRLLASRKRPGRLRLLVVSSLAACLSATVATLPLTVYYFGLVSVCSVMTNLLTLPVMNIMLVLGLISCLLGGIGGVAAFPVTLFSRYVLLVVHTVAEFPFAAAYTQNFPLVIWAVSAYCLAVFLLLRKKSVSFRMLSAVTAAFLVCVFWGSRNFSHDPPVYRILDVGQGQCVILETGELTAVVDCGGTNPEKAGEQAARTLNSAGKTRADILVLTHYDADHVGGVAQFLHRIKVGLVLLPNVADEKGFRQKIEAAAMETGAEIMTVTELTNVDFSGGRITVYPSLSPENENNAGICVLATAEEYDMLITGDLNQSQELRLLSQYELPQVEVLVAGHHGSDSSTGLTLLKTVEPELVAVSAARDNPYGHPAAETLARIERIGAEVVCTGETGDIVIRRR